MKIPKDYFDNVGFIYKGWYKVFSLLEAILPFSLISKIPFNIKNFSEKWVLLNSCLSISSLIITHFSPQNFLSKSFIMYGGIRIFEIIIYQVNVLLFHPYKNMVIKERKSYNLQNPYRSVILLLHNFLEIVCWFTSVSLFFSTEKHSILCSLMETTIRIFTFSYETISDQFSWFQCIIFTEVLCGIILVAISLAKLLGELPHINLEFEEDEEERQ